MTIAFPDISHYQAGLRIQPGTVAVCAKCSEGTYLTDASYADFKTQASNVNALFWAYHFLTAGNGAGQADYCFKIAGSTPVMLDVEPIPAQHSYPTVADIQAFVARYKKLGGRVCLAYIPRWYWQQMGSPDLTVLGLPIVASGYPGAYSDSDANWSPYGGVTPSIWQYTAAQPYGGMSVDFNAFRGTLQQLAALIQGDDMEPADVWSFRNASLDKIDMRQRLVNAEAAAAQAVSAINALAAKLANPPTIDVAALAQALAPLVAAGVTADQLAEAVVSHLAARFAKG